MDSTGIFWFTNDLRLHDQRALLEASQQVESLACIYILDHRHHLIHNHKREEAHLNIQKIDLGNHKIEKSHDSTLIKKNSIDQQKYIWSADENSSFGHAKQQFLYESLTSLAQSLSELNQELVILTGSPKNIINELIDEISADKVFRSNNPGNYENTIWKELKSQNIKRKSSLIQNKVSFTSIDTHTLFDRSDLTFKINDLADSFSKFKKVVSHYTISKPLKKIDWLPAPPNNLPLSISLEDSVFFKRPSLHTESKANKHIELSDKPEDHTSKNKVNGGENFGLTHLSSYFSGSYPSSYKKTRNELDGWTSSTKFSFWLANGTLSPKKIIASLKDFEHQKIENESTYWILFELLWREYFQWYAHKFDYKLFVHKGIKKTKPLTSFYNERYQRWRSGSTSYPLINALMKQLNATGYMSNRGRQIVASCFVHELQLDWRFGAAYFERHLIDYDVASNWGNWQYLAGVGADPRGHRRFDIQKQTQQYDPHNIFIDKWKGEVSLHPNDSVDAADWPIHH